MIKTVIIISAVIACINAEIFAAKRSFKVKLTNKKQQRVTSRSTTVETLLPKLAVLYPAVSTMKIRKKMKRNQTPKRLCSSLLEMSLALSLMLRSLLPFLRKRIRIQKHHLTSWSQYLSQVMLHLDQQHCGAQQRTL